LRAAAIGIGSNSLRMLVADVKDAQLHRVLRDREGLRVFAALDERGDIAEEMIQRACQSVGAMAQRARENGAQAIHLFATSAVRDARNQQAFIDRLFAATGLWLSVCTGETEAMLSFMGATGTERSGMVDIGGGSTEIVIGRGDALEFAESLQMGAVRLFRAMPIHNPHDAHAVVRSAKETLAAEKGKIRALQQPQRWVGVGGTFTTAAALAQGIPWDDRKRIHGYPLTREQVTAVMERLAAMPLAQRMELPGLQPQRADIIVHGMAILVCLMEELDIESITVSEYGNLEGYLKWKYLR
jgi:exopolyphosphatase / guanosine-5'-triphosphate,3'-diphosphate pyrophosphatase